jgi:carbamoyltransferase
MLYSAFTYYLGFAVNDGEYKVMGLAPYGEPRYVNRVLDNLIDLKADGSFRLDMRYFDYCTGLTMTNGRFADLFEGPRRDDAEPLTQRHMDIARSVQAVTEEAILRICRTLAKETGEKNLCLAGGVALNCVANGKVLRDGAFENIWIQPAAGDSGGALGIALEIDHCLGQSPRRTNGNNGDGMKGAYLGPAFGKAEVDEVIDRHDAVVDELEDDELYATVVDALAGEKVVGWFQGRMEFGPRALGNRSILADPRSRNMQQLLNMKIKYRESFRPFAPAVLAEKAADYFEIETESPYMLLVADMQASHRHSLSAAENELFGLDKLKAVRSDVPAITHVDYSARVQTVNKDSNPRFHRLLREFETRTGVPVLVNTSFNIRDEPIVCTPEEAFRCFMGTEMDMLVLGNAVLRKEDQW